MARDACLRILVLSFLALLLFLGLCLVDAKEILAERSFGVSQGQTSIELIACAAGSGLMDVSYDTHESYVRSVEDTLVQTGFSVEVQKEISYFDRNHPTS